MAINYLLSLPSLLIYHLIQVMNQEPIIVKITFYLLLIFFVRFLGGCATPASGEICSPSNGGGAGIGHGSHSQGNENITQKCEVEDEIAPVPLVAREIN